MYWRGPHVWCEESTRTEIDQLCNQQVITGCHTCHQNASIEQSTSAKLYEKLNENLIGFPFEKGLSFLGLVGWIHVDSRTCWCLLKPDNYHTKHHSSCPQRVPPRDATKRLLNAYGESATHSNRQFPSCFQEKKKTQLPFHQPLLEDYFDLLERWPFFFYYSLKALSRASVWFSGTAATAVGEVMPLSIGL